MERFYYQFNPARREVREKTDLMEWGARFEEAQRMHREGDPGKPDAWFGWWRVGREERDGIVVSTVFLGLNHEWEAGEPPLIFETMIFGLSGQDEGQQRYSTIDEAEAGHAEACCLVWPPAVMEGR